MCYSAAAGLPGALRLEQTEDFVSILMGHRDTIMNGHFDHEKKRLHAPRVPFHLLTRCVGEPPC